MTPYLSNAPTMLLLLNAFAPFLFAFLLVVFSSLYCLYFVHILTKILYFFITDILNFYMCEILNTNAPFEVSQFRCAYTKTIKLFNVESFTALFSPFSPVWTFYNSQKFAFYSVPLCHRGLLKTPLFT